MVAQFGVEAASCRHAGGVGPPLDRKLAHHPAPGPLFPGSTACRRSMAASVQAPKNAFLGENSAKAFLLSAFVFIEIVGPSVILTFQISGLRRRPSNPSGITGPRESRPLARIGRQLSRAASGCLIKDTRTSPGGWASPAARGGSGRKQCLRCLRCLLR